MEDIFSDEEQQIETPEVAIEPEAQTEGPVRDEQGRFAPKGEEQSASPAPVEEAPFDHAAVIGERKRRQEAEAKLAALEAQLQANQEPAAPPPSIWEDEQAARQYDQQQTVSQATFNARLDMSEMLASQNHDDFDDKKAKFVEMMSQNPALQRQALEAKHPWEKAYQIAANAMRMEALGAVDVTDIEAKLRAEIEAEYAARQQPAAPALPNSLAGAPSGRGTTLPGSTAFSLEDIIGR